MGLPGPIRRRFQSLEAGRGLEDADLDRLELARRREESRWRRSRAIGICGTVLLHFLTFLLFRGVDVPPPVGTAAAGPAAGDTRAAAGGSGLTMIEVRPAPPSEETAAPEPIPVPVLDPILPEEVEIPEEVTIPTPAPAPVPVPTVSAPGVGGPGQGGQGGPEEGQGAASGDGQGGGGAGDGGGTAQVVPPTPRGVIIPPAGQPQSARGREFTVWVFVTEAGRVQRNSIRLEPPTSDSRYNQRLMQAASEWIFDPATQGGRAIPFWYAFQFIL
jgi:hypothetical protein